MKKKFLLLNFLFASFFSNAQWNQPQVTGYVYDSNQWLFSLATYNPINDGTTEIGSFQNVVNGMGFSYTTAVDDRNMRYFCVLSMPSDGPYLYSVSLSDGHLLYKVPLTLSLYPEVKGSCSLIYDNTMDKLLAISNHSHEVFDSAISASAYIQDSAFLLQFDPESGATDTIMKMDPGFYGFLHQGIDEQQQVLYCVKENFDNTQQIAKIDLSSESVTLLPPFYYINSNLYLYTYDCVHGMIYDVEGAYYADDTTKGFQVIQINPDNGNKITLFSQTHYSLDETVVCINPYVEQIYFKGGTLQVQSQGSYFFLFNSFTYDIPSNQLVNISQNCTLRPEQYDLFVPWNLKSSFVWGNSCEGMPVHFTANGTPLVNYNWNFGDENSGGSNTSSLNNPDHEFTSSGNYLVTLLTETCRGVDTITQSVSITETPHVDLGDDILICTDQAQIVEVTAMVSGSGISYWQDGTYGINYNITQPGTYVLNFYNTCGKASDTLIAKGINCIGNPSAGCGASIDPTLTLNEFTVTLGCTLDQMQSVRCYVFDVLGRKVRDLAITNQIEQIPLAGLAAGTYFVQVRNPSLLDAEKVVLMR